MPAIDAILLMALAAIWGSSFMFIRFLAPLIGPVAVADTRMLFAGIALVLFFAVKGFRAGWKANSRHFLAIGLLNSAIPFVLYAGAALALPASMEAIFNSMSPMFGAVFAALWLNEKLTPRKVAGLVLGVGGVVVMSSLSGLAFSAQTLLAIGACILAPMCYGIAGVYIRKRAANVRPLGIAGGSQLFGGLVLSPFVAFFPPPAGSVTPTVAAAVVALALFCSGVAYVIYYRLISDVGPTKALTVTFLIPVFAMLWASLLIHEAIRASMILGAVIILLATWLVAGKPFSFSGMRRRPVSADHA